MVNSELTWPGNTGHYSSSNERSVEELKMTEVKEASDELHRQRNHFHTVSEVGLMKAEVHKGDSVNSAGREVPEFGV